MVFILYFPFLFSTSADTVFPFTRNMHSFLGCAIFLQQLCFSLEDSFLPEFPPHTKSFIKYNLFQRCTICQVHPPVIYSYKRRTLLQDADIWHNSICLPNRLPLQKVHSSTRNILFTRFILLAGVFPLVSFPLHHFFLKVLFGSQIAETACDKASTSD